MKTWTTPEGTYNKLFDDMIQENHLLIAGATGSGKSVVLNGIIARLLFNAPPENKLILIDPKRVELSIYKDLPHCIGYASEPEAISILLGHCIDEMEKRYKEMESQRLRKYEKGHIYIIIDEYADLVLTSKKETENKIQRIAQLGRAANIHIILATQCVLAEVINTKIKCNFPARIALKTSNAQDSRNIIDRSGAELLPRYGQCIYHNPIDGDLIYNVPMVPDEEINKLIDFWMKQKET